MSEPQTSGADLARMALRAARDNARKTSAPTDQQKRKQRATITRDNGRDPAPLGNVIARVEQAYDWRRPKEAGSLIDRWADIVPPELARTAVPERYDTERRVLHIRPVSPAYATHLRLMAGQLGKLINDRVGDELVRAVKVLPPGGRAAAALDVQRRPEPAEPARPVDVGNGTPPTAAMRAAMEELRAGQVQREVLPEAGQQPGFRTAYGWLREPEAVSASEDAESRQARESAERHARALAVARTARRTGDPTPLRLEGAA